MAFIGIVCDACKIIVETVLFGYWVRRLIDNHGEKCYNASMRAWQITSPRNFDKFESASEKPEAGFVKIKVGQYLITSPDMETYLGNSTAALPIIPGDSCCGMVVQTGEGTEFVRGDRVYVHPQMYCGQCTACKSGRFFNCENPGQFGITANGFLRDFAVIRAVNCTKLPERIDNDEAIFLDYIALAVQALNTMDIDKGDFIAISGATTLGIILAQVTLYFQAVPILVDTSEANLELARSFGIYYTINTKTEFADKRIFHLTGGKMAKHAAHLVGSGVPLKQSASFVGANGKFILLGRFVSREDVSFPIAHIMTNNISVIGVTDGAKNTQVAVNMLANKAVSVLPFIEKTVGYEDIPKVFAQNADKAPSAYKTLIKFD